MKVKDYLIGLVLAAVAFVYYYLQACPTFYYWDSAELAASIAGNGVPHPPGFPLYLLLNRLFSLFISSDIGRATALFSVVCGSLAVAVFYLFLVKVVSQIKIEGNIKSLASIGITWALIVSHSLSAQATRAEVYSLNLLLFILAFYFGIDALSKEIDEGKRGRHFILSLLFVGLGLANHHLTIFLVLPAIIYVAIKAKFNSKTLLLGAIALVLPLSLYLYLVVLARQTPNMNWGNPTGLKALFDVVTANGFSKPIGALTPSHIAENFAAAFSLLYRQIGPILMVLAIAGVIFGAREKQKVIYVLVLILFFNVCSTILNESYYYENLDFHGYLLFSLVVLLSLAVVGMIYIVKRLPSRNRIIAVSLIAIISIALPGYANIGNASLAGNESAKRFASTIVDECPKGALVITSSYNTYFIISALQNVYGYRTDLNIVHSYLFGQEWYRDNIIKRFKLQRSAGSLSGADEFYRYLINNFIMRSEIYIEYDELASPLRLYLWPETFWMRFKSERFDFNQNGGEDSVAVNLARIEKYLQSGTDYEELKSMLWLLNNRAGFYKAIGEQGIVNKYLDEIDKVTENYYEK
jgi:hypothetical protein